jgi:hypothetical protein
VTLHVKENTKISLEIMNIGVDYYVEVGEELKELGIMGRLHVPRTYAIKNGEISPLVFKEDKLKIETKD